MFIDDLNYDMLFSDKSCPLQNIYDIFVLTKRSNLLYAKLKPKPMVSSKPICHTTA